MPVKFEFLEGDPNFFAQNLSGDDQGKQVLATFAFRVTDPATGQLVGKFDKPVVWSVTGAAIDSESDVYNVSAANPPKITENPTKGTLQGNTLTHSFGGAGVGWLVLGPPAAPAPAGMPTTGAGTFNGVDGILPVALLVSALVLVGGLRTPEEGEARCLVVNRTNRQEETSNWVCAARHIPNCLLSNKARLYVTQYPSLFSHYVL